MRTVITGAPGGESAAERESEAAAVLNGFEGVRLDAEAEAAIAAALEACAARAREADAAYGQGGEAAADAAEGDPGESFFRSEEYRGELLPACEVEDFVPFVEGEAPWSLAGAEKPEMLVQFEEEMAERKAETEEAAPSSPA